MSATLAPVTDTGQQLPWLPVPRAVLGWDPRGEPPPRRCPERMGGPPRGGQHRLRGATSMPPPVGLASSSRGAQGRKDFTFMLIKTHSSAVHLATGEREASAGRRGARRCPEQAVHAAVSARPAKYALLGARGHFLGPKQAKEGRLGAPSARLTLDSRPGLVTVSRFVGSSPVPGSVLTVRSWLGTLPPPLSPPLPCSHTLTLSPKNKRF